MKTYYIAPDFSCFECRNDSSDGNYQYLDTSVESGITDHSPIESYGSDRDLAGWTAYNIGSGQSNITLEALEALLTDMTSLSFSQSMNVENNFREGVLYDHEDEDYTEWDDLEEDFQESIEHAIHSSGSYGTDVQTYYLPHDITSIYVECLTEMIKAVKAYQDKVS